MINATTAKRILRFMPFLETVTYFNRTSADTYASQTVPRARRKKVQKQDAAFSEEILVEAELSWELMAAYLTVTPQQDDYLTDSSGTGWTILHVTTQFNGAVFVCLCRKRVP